MAIATLGWSWISDRHTFGYLFKRNFDAPATIRRDRERITDMIWQFVRKAA